MDLKAGKKRQLAAAVTLAVMGMAWVAVPQQVWAANGGNRDLPLKYSSYEAENKTGGAIDKARTEKTGDDMYAAQYHEGFTDASLGVLGDMQGRSITLASMEVAGVIGANGQGGAAGSTTAPVGPAGGIGSAIGIYSSNILNARITFGDITIAAVGGNGSVGSQGEQGNTANTGKGGTGGHGGNGGNGGLALATGLELTGSNNTVTGGVLAVTATGADGGKGGIGGKGGTGAAGTDGINGGDGGQGTDGTNVTTANTNGNAGGKGGTGVAGTNGTGGSEGGMGGYGGDAGNGGNAEATGLKIAQSSAVTTVKLGGLAVTAAAGNGGASGAGGLGGDGGQGGDAGNGGKGGHGGNGSDATNGYTAGAGGDGGNGGNGGNGAVGGTGGVGGHGGANSGTGGTATALGLSGSGSVLDLTVGGAGIVVTATGGNGGQGGCGGVGGTGGVGGDGGTGGAGGDHGSNGTTGQNPANSPVVGTAGTDGAGATGGKGGDGGWAGWSANGGDATAKALDFAASQVTVRTDTITATATAGTGVGKATVNDVYVNGGGTANTDNNGGAATDKKGGDGGKGLSPTKAGNGGKLDYFAASSNGATATATALTAKDSAVNTISDAGLAITAIARNALSNTAVAVSAENSDLAYKVAGDLTITAGATFDQTQATYKDKDEKDTITNTSTAVEVTGGSLRADVDGKLTVWSGAGDNSANGTNSTDVGKALVAEKATIDLHSKQAMYFEVDNAWKDAHLTGQTLTATDSNMTFTADAGGITVKGEVNATDYAAKITGGTTTFNSGTDLTSFVGSTSFLNGTANLQSNTSVTTNQKDVGNLDITGTTMNLTDNLQDLTVAGKTTMAGSTVYFYDKNDPADKYKTGEYRTFTTNDLEATGTNEFFMRTNANGAYGQSAGNDKIVSTNTATGSGTYDINLFDQGMRNGFNNAADADGNNLKTPVNLIQNADKNGTYNIKEMQYDNGIWAYEYAGKAEVDADGNLSLTKIATTVANQAAAQKAAQDANKLAAGAAVTLFGSDETLMERLGDVRNSADDNDGVWAKYVGGKIKVDGISGDNDFKYNGFAAGYDHEIGSNWRIGLAGQYAKGDTTLSNGDGEIKTAAGALYGTWTGDKGHHVDIIAKVGKVDSETSAYGGSIAQKLDGDFGSTAMSFAVEYGYRQDLKDGWFVEPMLRASYVHLGGDDYTVTTRDNSMSVTNDSMNSIVLRGGFLLGRTFAEASNVYLKAAVLHDFDGDINTHISADGRSASYSDSIGGTAIEYGLGVNHKFNKDSSMYFDVERISGGDVTKNWGVNVGFRYSF